MVGNVRSGLNEKMKSIQTPILLITFNRPNHTRRVLEAIKNIQICDLYVFQDGARQSNEGDVVKCESVRCVIEEMTSGTGFRIHKYFSDKNLGCGPGPAAALDWFFEHEKMGIVLEDDAVPHPDFFLYAEELLQKYEEDESVFAIGSMNVDTQKWGDGSYYFSMMNRNLCAWATWRRAWEHFDLRLLDVSCRQLRNALRWYGCGQLEQEYWCNRLIDVQKDGCEGQSWDMQFFMSIWLNHGKGIIPNVNLSSNIGIGEEATHVISAGSLIDNVPTQSILPVCHPSSYNVQRDADRQFHFRYFEIDKAGWGRIRTCYYVLNKRLKRMVGHHGSWLRGNK